MRMVIKFFLIFIIILFDFCLSQNVKRDNLFKNVNKYSLIEFSRAQSKDTILVTAFVEIPFNSLQFIKKEKSFFASYDVSITLTDKKGQRIFRKMWSDSIITNDYLHTKSQFRSKKHYTNIQLTKSKYTLSSELYDKDTRNKGLKKIDLDFSKKNKNPCFLMPIITTNLEGDWGFGANEFPITGKRITNIDNNLKLIVSGFLDQGPYEIKMFVNGLMDSGKEKILKNESSKGFFIHRFELDKDYLSAVAIKIELKLKQNNKEKSIFKNISIYKPGLSGFVNDVENSFHQMKYILTNEERKNSKGKKGKELEDIFLSYWKKRDPTPDTNINELMEEYYIRVNYVNEYFNMSWREGWETDLGMVYILFGPPDRIQRSNISNSNNSSYQIWYYNRLNKQFFFKDQNGFGDFKLDRPFIGSDF